MQEAATASELRASISGTSSTGDSKSSKAAAAPSVAAQDAALDRVLKDADGLKSKFDTFGRKLYNLAAICVALALQLLLVQLGQQVQGGVSKAVDTALAQLGRAGSALSRRYHNTRLVAYSMDEPDAVEYKDAILALVRDHGRDWVAIAGAFRGRGGKRFDWLTMYLAFLRVKAAHPDGAEAALLAGGAVAAAAPASGGDAPGASVCPEGCTQAYRPQRQPRAGASPPDFAAPSPGLQLLAARACQPPSWHAWWAARLQALARLRMSRPTARLHT